jgi:hypothetical protein
MAEIGGISRQGGPVLLRKKIGFQNNLFLRKIKQTKTNLHRFIST